MLAFSHAGVGQEISNDQYSLSTKARNNDVVVEAIDAHMHTKPPLTLPLSPWGRGRGEGVDSCLQVVCHFSFFKDAQWKVGNHLFANTAIGFQSGHPPVGRASQ